MNKKLILVTSPPACGKTYVAKALAKQLHNIVYLDKDTLIVLSKQIFKVAGHVGSGNDRQNRRRQHGTGVAVLGGKRHSPGRENAQYYFGLMP